MFVIKTAAILSLALGVSCAKKDAPAEAESQDSVAAEADTTPDQGDVEDPAGEGTEMPAGAAAGDDAILVSEDFAEEAEADITADNLDAELKALDEEIGQEN